jgi:microcystin-dependent protein
MSEPFIAEIRCFGFTFAPRGWAQCNGQLLPISQNSALFALIGTTYGGDGSTTFALPNLQGRIPMHWGNGPGGFTTQIGEVQGQTAVTLTTLQIPQHVHAVVAAVIQPGASAERSAIPTDTSFLSAGSGEGLYQKAPATPNTPFSPKAISPAGGSQPHDNMQPYLVINFCMALEGIFPSQN